MIKSVIYDVDGTLWDSTALVAENWQRVCGRRGIPCGHISADALRQEFGKLLADIGRSLFPELPEGEMLSLIRECCDTDNAYLLEKKQPLYPGVYGTIRILHERGIRQVIVSNCTEGYIETLIAIHHLENLIDGHLCAGDTGFGKSENIRIACRKYGLADPVYVGDTRGDFNSSREAGVPFVFAAYGFGEVPEPDYVIDKPEDLLKVV